MSSPNTNTATFKLFVSIAQTATPNRGVLGRGMPSAYLDKPTSKQAGCLSHMVRRGWIERLPLPKGSSESGIRLAITDKGIDVLADANVEGLPNWDGETAAPSSSFATREEWLQAASARIRKHVGSLLLEMAPADAEIAFEGCDWDASEAPDRARREAEGDTSQGGIFPSMRMACSHPLNGVNNRIRGEWLGPKHSADSTHEITISPKLDDPAEVLIVLVHEMIHAATNGYKGHGAPFARIAMVCQFARPFTSSQFAGDCDMKRFLSRVASDLGGYPHARINVEAVVRNRKKQSTRSVKAECPTVSCDFKYRASMTWHRLATAICPVCEGSGVHARTVVTLGDGETVCTLAGRQAQPDGSTDDLIRQEVAEEAAAAERAREAEEARARQEQEERVARIRQERAERAEQLRQEREVRAERQRRARQERDRARRAKARADRDAETARNAAAFSAGLGGIVETADPKAPKKARKSRRNRKDLYELGDEPKGSTPTPDAPKRSKRAARLEIAG